MRSDSIHQRRLLAFIRETLSAPTSGMLAGQMPNNVTYGVGKLGSRVKEPIHDENPGSEKLAACVLILRDGLVLAVSRKNDPNDMGLPGGKAEPLEELNVAAARELREETGVSVDPAVLVPVYDAVDSGGYHTHTFSAEWDQCSGTIGSSEEGRVKWIKPSVLLDGSFSAYNAEMLARAGVQC